MLCNEAAVAPPLIIGLQPSALVDHLARVDSSLLHILRDKGGSIPISVEELEDILHRVKMHLASNEHYVCFVNLLGREGHTEAISCLFNKAMRAGAALLNACKINHDVARGEIACLRLLESEPNSPLVAYRSSFELLCSHWSWDAVDILRSTMKTGGINKEVGISWVTTETGTVDEIGIMVFKLIHLDSEIYLKMHKLVNHLELCYVDCRSSFVDTCSPSKMGRKI